MKKFEVMLDGYKKYPFKVVARDEAHAEEKVRKFLKYPKKARLVRLAANQSINASWPPPTA